MSHVICTYAYIIIIIYLYNYFLIIELLVSFTYKHLTDMLRSDFGIDRAGGQGKQSTHTSRSLVMNKKRESVDLLSFSICGSFAHTHSYPCYPSPDHPDPRWSKLLPSAHLSVHLSAVSCPEPSPSIACPGSSMAPARRNPWQSMLWPGLMVKTC